MIYQGYILYAIWQLMRLLALHCMEEIFRIHLNDVSSINVVCIVEERVVFHQISNFVRDGRDYLFHL